MKGLNLISRLMLLAVMLASQTTALNAQCISGNCQNGTGTYRYSGNSKYTGQFQNNLRHGKGKMTYPDGNVYHKKLEANVERYSRTPAAGIVVQGSTGEAILLSDQERRDVLKTAIAAAAFGHG